MIAFHPLLISPFRIIEAIGINPLRTAHYLQNFFFHAYSDFL